MVLLIEVACTIDLHALRHVDAVGPQHVCELGALAVGELNTAAVIDLAARREPPLNIRRLPQLLIERVQLALGRLPVGGPPIPSSADAASTMRRPSSSNCS